MIAEEIDRLNAELAAMGDELRAMIQNLGGQLQREREPGRSFRFWGDLVHFDDDPNWPGPPGTLH